MSVTDNEESLLVTSTSPHIHCGSSVCGIMRDVILSLVPCCLASVFFFGWRAALLIAVCSANCFENPYVWRCFLELKWRDVPLFRSTNDVFTVLEHGESSSTAARAASLPRTTSVRTSTTRPFARVFFTVA